MNPDGRHHPRVLVVDDDPEVCEMLLRQLQRFGYSGLACRGGAQAVEDMKADVPDGVILDMIMPGLDGVDTIGRIKSTRELRHVPILVITGSELNRSRSEILEGFGIPAIAKPWDIEELIDGLEESIMGKQYLSRRGAAVEGGRET